MEQKTNSLKTACKVISVISKIVYTAMIVMICISAVLLVFLAVTGGDTSGLTVGGVNIHIFDKSEASPAEFAVICTVLIVMGGMLLAIFGFAHKMFKEISITGKPFIQKYVNTIRIVGILTAVMPIVVGTTKAIASAVAGASIPEVYSDLPGIGVGAVIYCLSYIIDYGCGLATQKR